MGKKDPRIDTYIAKSADFARPILSHLRNLIHETCPDVEETMKWNFPHFEYKGILCSMASFKKHCAFGFWKSDLIVGLDKATQSKTEEAMGQFGRIMKLSDLPVDRAMRSLIKKAVKLNEDGVKAPSRTKSTSPGSVPVPDYFLTALRRNKQALKVFDEFSPSHKREYVEWITEAKGEDTRQRRLAQAIEWLAQGKSRNWKYNRK